MPAQNQEIYFITIIGIILGLLLVGFIVAMLVIHKRSQQKQEREMAIIKESYEKEVLRSQLEIQENTFKNISQELHDNIGQMLSVVKLSLSAMPIEKGHPAYELSQHSAKVLTKAIFDLSDLTKSLHTDRITDVGLVESIKYELATIKAAGLVQVQFGLTGVESPLPDQKAIFLFRMFQEILNNILKHSKATIVNVRISYAEDQFSMAIDDNGIGFNPQALAKSHAPGKGVGLKSIFNRAQMIGATVKTESEEGKGTRILVELPLQP